jgi:putative ABC transport system permease protein
MVQHELSFDRYHKNFDRIYRVTHAFPERAGRKVLPPPTPEQFQVWGCAPIGPAIAADFPAIDKVSAVLEPYRPSVTERKYTYPAEQPVIHGFHSI